jgi:inosine-uridine nucleoside N-ribohydrolase
MINKNEKILLSTDIGSDIDDALAFLSMINSGMDIRGVYTVNGDVAGRAFIAREIADLSRKNIDISTGESKPMGRVEPHNMFIDCFVQDKYRDNTELLRETVYRPLEQFQIKKNGLEDMAEKLSREQHAVFSIGPMTTLAKLLDKYPKSAENISRIYAMACRFFEEDKLAHEHNIRYDIPAAQRVLSSSVPITVISANLCDKYRMPVEMLKNVKTPAGKYVKKMADGFVNAKTAKEFCIADLGREIENGFDSRGLEIDHETGMKVLESKSLTAELNDHYYAAMDPEKYSAQYARLINNLQGMGIYFPRMPILSSVMQMAVPKDIAVHDVYVPYCCLNSDKIETEQATIKVDNGGYSRKTVGNKHTIVTDIDYTHFRDFLEKHIQ